MESSIAEFLQRMDACELHPTNGYADDGGVEERWRYPAARIHPCMHVRILSASGRRDSLVLARVAERALARAGARDAQRRRVMGREEGGGMKRRGYLKSEELHWHSEAS